MEIQALREDINEVRRCMYRTQLNVLLEEKTSNGTPPTTNGAQVTINKAAYKDTKSVVPTSFTLIFRQSIILRNSYAILIKPQRLEYPSTWSRYIRLPT